MRLRKIKLTTFHFASHYCEKNRHISHTCSIKRKYKKYVKQVWVPKKIVPVNDVKANTQGPHIKWVLEETLIFCRKKCK